MGNFIGEQLAKFINQKIEGVGVVESVNLGSDSVKAVIVLRGEPEPVNLQLLGIRWSTSDGKFHIHFDTALASKEWIQAALNIVAERTAKRISLPDKLSLMPVKMMFPKA